MVRWKEPEFSNRFVVRLGEFHTMMSFMTAIAKRFDGFGFKDIVIESGLVAEEVIKGILTGKHYYRSIMVHIFMFEALSRLRFESFLNSLDVDNRREVEDFCLLLMELHGTSEFHWYIESGLFVEIRVIIIEISIPASVGIIKSTKSKLINILEDKCIDKLSVDIPKNNALILDGMAILQIIKPIPENFEKLSRLIFTMVINFAISQIELTLLRTGIEILLSNTPSDKDELNLVSRMLLYLGLIKKYPNNGRSL
ncbi:uncharacterized protein LOC136088983 [Hydra vulgaris]|uniref:Uncharacterized protein LOC136088983 n=1 Tax=Hydra vulgaris TaxID=6087 RepID=A0ABM4D7U4_HYDVU